MGGAVAMPKLQSLPANNNSLVGLATLGKACSEVRIRLWIVAPEMDRQLVLAKSSSMSPLRLE